MGQEREPRRKHKQDLVDQAPAKSTRRPYAYVTKANRVVRADILEQYAVKASVSRQLDIDLFHRQYGRWGLVQPLYNPEALARLLELNTYHFRCCKTKARDTAGLDWNLQPVIKGAPEAQRVPVDKFFLGLKIPAAVTLERAQLDFEAVGYAGIELVREDYAVDGAPIDLLHIPAYTLRMHRSQRRVVQMRDTRTRWFRVAGVMADVDAATGEEHEVGTLPVEKRASEIFWLVNYTPRSDFYGLPDIIPALGALHGDIARRDYNIAFFTNHGVPAWAVFISGDFDEGTPDPETGLTEIEQAIEEHVKELAKNPHSVLVISVPSTGAAGEVKIEFQRLAAEMREVSFRLYRTDNRDEILAAHGVPPYRAGIAETGSLGGSTAVESSKIYKDSVIEPRQARLEDMINRHILWAPPWEAQDWEFQLAAIDTSDEAHDLLVMSGLFDKGACTPNQLIRFFGERFGLEPFDHPALDAYYLAGQPITLENNLGPDVEAALRSLHSELLEVAVKYTRRDAGQGLLDVLNRVKGLSSRLAGRRT